MIIKLHGIEFCYEDDGEGNPILFIHGYPLNRSLWNPQIKELSKSYRTIAIDLRGHGDSQAVSGPYSMDMLAEDCSSLLDALNINTPVVVCGLSMGGYVSLAFYRKYPERISGLVLAATRAGADSVAVKANRENAIQLAGQQGSLAIAESMLPKMFSQETYITKPALVDFIREMMAHTSVEGIMGALGGMRDRMDSTYMLPLIKVPTLIIHGANDQLIPVSVAQEMHAAIPGSKITVLPEAGHLVNLEQPSMFTTAIDHFVASTLHLA